MTILPHKVSKSENRFRKEQESRNSNSSENRSRASHSSASSAGGFLVTDSHYNPHQALSASVVTVPPPVPVRTPRSGHVLPPNLVVHQNPLTVDGTPSAVKPRKETDRRERSRKRPFGSLDTGPPPPVAGAAAPSTPGYLSGGGTKGLRRTREQKQRESEGDEGEDEGGYNSDDEHFCPERKQYQFDEQREVDFEAQLKAKRGFEIVKMETDGACLFRAFAHQIFGDQSMHNTIRRDCINFMEKNTDHFSQYCSEDFTAYLSRKRHSSCYGNHLEIQALSELFSRPIEVYQYQTEPINIFCQDQATDAPPIRLSYHYNCHYNSVIDPYKATIGVGLGLPGHQPGVSSG